MRRGVPFFVCGIAAWTVFEETRLASLQTRLRVAEDRLAEAYHDAKRIGADLSEERARVFSLQNQAQQAEERLTQARSESDEIRARLLEKDRQIQQREPTAASVSKSGETATFTENLITLAERAARIDRYFKERPEWEIPEIGLLKEGNWINIASAHGQLKTTDQIHQALRAVIQEAKSEAASQFGVAGQLAPDFSSLQSMEQLLPFLKKSMTPEMIARYERIPASKLEPEWLLKQQLKGWTSAAGSPNRPAFLIREKQPVVGDQQVVVFFTEDGQKTTAQSYFQVSSEGSP